MPAPAVSTGAVIAAPALVGAGAMPVPAISAGVVVSAPALIGAGVLPIPVVSGGAGASAPVLAGAGTVPTPSVGAGVTISAPALAGAGSVPVPTVTAGGAISPMGMDKSGTMAVGSDQTALITGFVARSGYASTVITSNQLVSNGGGNVLVTARITLSGNWFSGTALIVRIMQNGSALSTTTIPFGSAVANFTAVAATLANTHTIGLNFTSPFGGSSTINAGSTSTYVYYDLA
jgi:hypothetical protein